MGYGFISSRAAPDGTTFYQVPIGGGGFFTGISIANDGTVFCKNDGGIAYRLDPVARHWNNITTTQSMPPGFQNWTLDIGVYAIAVAPTDSNRVYIVHQGFFFKSTDGGNTFVNMPSFFGGSALPQGSVTCNTGSVRLNGPRMAVDPNNPDIVLVGTGVNGVYLTRDGGNSFTGPLPIPPTPPVTPSGSTGLNFLFNNSLVATVSSTGTTLTFGPYTATTQATSPSTTKVIAVASVRGILVGASVADVTTPANIPTGTTVTAISGLNVTVSKVVNVGLDTLQFTSVNSTATIGNDSNWYVYNQSNLANIPVNTTVTAPATATTVTISAPGTVTAGDTISFSHVSAANAYAGYSIAFDPTTAARSGAATTQAVGASNSNTITVASAVGILVGAYVIDTTTPSNIPANTTVVAVVGSSVTVSNTVSVGNNDTLVFGPYSTTQYVSGYFSPLYKSTDGGTTWAPLNSGTFPNSAQCIRVGPDQTLWVVSDNSDFTATLNNVWSCTTGGVWTQYTKSQIGQTNQAHCLIVCGTDTLPNIRIVVFGSSMVGFGYSTNNFSSPGANYGNGTISCDASWLNSQNHVTSAMGWAEFDPSRTDAFLWTSNGVGMFNTNIPASHTTTVPYIGVVSGAENLAASQSASPPGPGTHVWLTVWDQVGFVLNPLGVLATTQTILKLPTNNAICAGWGLDYASSDPTFMCLTAAFSSMQSSFSTDGGLTVQAFPVQNPGIGGCIAAATPNDIVQIPGAQGAPGLPKVTNNQGVSWYTPAELPTNGFGYVAGSSDKAAIVCADRNVVDAPGTFYLYYTYTLIQKAASASTTNVISFSLASSLVHLQPGYIVTDTTTPSAIPNGTTIISISGTDVTVSNTVNVGANDSISFTDPGNGVWRSINKGQSWSQVHVGELSIGSNSGTRIMSVPGQPGGTLLICGSKAGVLGTILKSTDGGFTWANINTLLSSIGDFGLGAPLPGSGQTVTIWMFGKYNNQFGVFKSHDFGNSFVFVSPGNLAGSLPNMGNIGGDMNVYGRAYISCTGLAWFYCNYVSGP